MNITYKLAIEHQNNKSFMSDAQYFAEEFSDFRKGAGWFFFFEKIDDLNRAKIKLTKSNFPWKIIYQIRATKRELPSIPALFPGISSEYNIIGENNIIVSKNIKGYELIEDIETGKIITNENVKNIIKTNSKNIEFETMDSDNGNTYYLMKIKNRIQQGIGVVKTLGINHISENEHFVVSDGRYFINESDKKLIDECGLAEYTKIFTEGKYYNTRNEILISSILAKTLIENKTKGISKLNNMTIILSEEHPILSE